MHFIDHIYDTEDDGATPFVMSRMYGASVGSTVARDKAVRLVPLLATSSLFERWDVRNAKKSARTEVDEDLTSVETVLTKSIQPTSYRAHSTARKKNTPPHNPSPPPANTPAARAQK